MTILLYQFVITCFITRCISLIVANTNCSTTLYLWSRVLLVKLINSGATQEIPHCVKHEDFTMFTIICHWSLSTVICPIFMKMHQNIILLSVPSPSSGFLKLPN